MPESIPIWLNQNHFLTLQKSFKESKFKSKKLEINPKDANNNHCVFGIVKMVDNSMIK